MSSITSHQNITHNHATKQEALPVSAKKLAVPTKCSDWIPMNCLFFENLPLCAFLLYTVLWKKITHGWQSADGTVLRFWRFPSLIGRWKWIVRTSQNALYPRILLIIQTEMSRPNLLEKRGRRPLLLHHTCVTWLVGQCVLASLYSLGFLLSYDKSTSNPQNKLDDTHN